MKIVSIFGTQLFSFYFEMETDNELSRLLGLRNNFSYLNEFTETHHHDIPILYSKEDIMFHIREDALEIDRFLMNLSIEKYFNWNLIFKPLNNNEYYVTMLSEQKWRKRFLRLYAIKIDHDCYVITGGAIKFHHHNKDRPHTQNEMNKLSMCRDFLQANGVFDADSFYEFLNETK